MFGRKAQDTHTDALKASHLRDERTRLKGYEARLRAARAVARNAIDPDPAADRIIARRLQENIAVTKANIRDLQR